MNLLTMLTPMFRRESSTKERRTISHRVLPQGFSDIVRHLCSIFVCMCGSTGEHRREKYSIHQPVQRTRYDETRVSVEMHGSDKIQMCMQRFHTFPFSIKTVKKHVLSYWEHVPLAASHIRMSPSQPPETSIFDIGL